MKISSKSPKKIAPRATASPPLPFTEILEPLARQRFAQLPEVSKPIREEFARQLETRWAGALGPVLFLQFSAHRAAEQMFNRSTNGAYVRFVAEVQSNGLADSLRPFPVAQAAFETLAAQAQTASRSFATHLAADETALTEFLGGDRLGELASVTGGWSDPHRGGRTVLEVTFANGRRVFYKPRSVAVDRVWGEEWRRLTSALGLESRAARALDVGDHGWMEAMAEARHLTRAEAERFYRRYGMMLALAWLLDAMDLHRENVLIAGEHPVLVDAEALLHPVDEERTLARTGLLPGATDLDVPDVSALGNVAAQFGIGRMRWDAVNTDAMELRIAPGLVPAATHLPLVDGTIFPPSAGRAALLAGFETAVALADAERATIEAWRAAVAAAPRRRIDRPTIVYGEALRLAAQPASLVSHAAWTAKLTSLLDPPFRADELAQLADWDVPTFAVEPARDPGPAPWADLEARRQELAGAALG